MVDLPITYRGMAYSWQCDVNGHLNVMWHTVRTYMLVWHRLRWFNRHHVPLSQGAIIASNHTTGLDGFMIQIAGTLPFQLQQFATGQFEVHDLECM